MLKRIAMLPIGAAVLHCAAPGQAVEPKSSRVTDATATLPQRVLDCTLVHALNLDARKFQSIADITYEGRYAFSVVLPPSRRHVGPPPDPAAAPEPFDPATGVVADPSVRAADMERPLVRVGDLWPERVELVGQIKGTPFSRLFILSEIDERKGSANLFMTRAADAASLDLGNVYQGGCSIRGGRNAK
jgi:hypothetical protein